MAENQTPPLLVGFIIDLSVSMKRSWRNRDGKVLPRAQVIRDVLTRELKSAARVRSNAAKVSQIEIFALGMGLKRTQEWVSVDLRYHNEKTIPGTTQRLINAGVVCDLIALAEIVPSSNDLELLSKSINSKWQSYVQDFFDNAKIDKDIENQLHEFFREFFRDRALHRFQNSIAYFFYKWILATKSRKFPDILEDILKSIVDRVEGREHYLKDNFNSVDDRFFKSVIEKAKEHFDHEKEGFKVYIQDKIRQFVRQQCILLSDLLALGQKADTLIEALDEVQLRKLASEIYAHLSSSIEQSIGVMWQITKGMLLLEATTSGIKLDQSRLKDLTSKCVQKYSWDYLQPFVESTVKNLFRNTFDEIAQDNLSNWIGLASQREVIRPISDVVSILPETIDRSLFLDSVMFGGTPIYEATQLASLRLMDKRYEKYNKVLIIISDGKFETTASARITTRLHQAGVNIICCYIVERDVMSTLTSKRKSKWPNGAKMMFDMASTYDEQSFIAQAIQKRGFKVENGAKLFIQINHSELIGEIASEIFGTSD